MRRVQEKMDAYPLRSNEGTLTLTTSDGTIYTVRIHNVDAILRIEAGDEIIERTAAGTVVFTHKEPDITRLELNAVVEKMTQFKPDAD